MENVNYSDELQHHGIRGQKWGQRRYQNKDGSLTPAGQKRYNKEVEKLKKETAKVKAAEQVAANRKKTQAKLDRLDAKKQALEERKKALKEEKYGKKKKGDTEENKDETPEQRKERLLKSSDPKELYKYRDELSTLELNDRINRIDTENRLQSKIVEEHKTTGLEYMDKAKNVIDKSTNLFKSVDNAYSAVTNSAIGKTLAKQLGIEVPSKKYDYNIDNFLKNISSKSPKEINEFNQVQNNIDKLKGRLNKNSTDSTKESKKAAKKAEKEAAKQAKKDANKTVDDDDSTKTSDTNKSNNTSKETNNQQKSNDAKAERIRPEDVEIVGEGTSKSNMNSGKKWWDTSDVSETIWPDYESYVNNQRTTNNLLESSVGRTPIALLEEK